MQIFVIGDNRFPYRCFHLETIKNGYKCKENKKKYRLYSSRMVAKLSHHGWSKTKNILNAGSAIFKKIFKMFIFEREREGERV